MKINHRLQAVLALILSVLLSPAPLLCQGAGNQQAGDVANLDPAATRNGATAQLKEVVFWNDRLKTDPQGRLRVALRDGSSLSLGSDSELVVVQHDPSSQQTTLQLFLGRIREKVTKLTQPNSKFETNTPHASLGVIGTDFYVEVTPNATTVVVYSGIVRVTPLLAAGAANVGRQAQSVSVAAGQTVTVTSSGIVGAISAAPQPLIQTSITNTLVKGVGTKTAAVGGSHLVRNLLIGLGAAGAGVGIGMAVNNSGKSSGPSIPPK